MPRDADKGDLSEYSTFADFFHLLEIRLVAALLKRLEHHARLFGCGNHGIDIGGREAEGFFAHHVLTRFQCLQSVTGVKTIRRGDHNQIDLGIIHQPRDVVVGAAAVGGLGFCGARLIDIGGSDNAIAIRQVFQSVLVDAPAAASQAGDADVNDLFVVHFEFLFQFLTVLIVTYGIPVSRRGCSGNKTL
jgi:hypothetical protein